MPPRKKIVKKTTPARRTSTRRSTAALAAAEQQPVLPETEVETPVSEAPEKDGIASDAHGSGDEEKERDGVFSIDEAPVSTSEGRKKGKRIKTSTVDTPLVADEGKDTVPVGTPVVVCEGRKRGSGTPSIETPVSVDQKSEGASVASPETRMGISRQDEGKDSVLVGTPVPERGEKEKDSSFFETPVSVYQKSEAAFVGSSEAGMPAPPQEEGDNSVLSGTPADACEGKKGTGTPSIETPVSVDQKSGAAVVGPDETQTPPPTQDAAMVVPTTTVRASDGEVGSGGKPDGPKKAVKIVKKVTRRVVVKKNPKIVNKDEEKREEAGTVEGGAVAKDKECEPKRSSDATVLGGEMGVEVDKECKPATCLDNKVVQVEGSMTKKDKDCDASMLEGGQGIEEQNECKPASNLNGDVSVENAQARNREAENATRAISSAENPLEQEQKTDVEDLPVLDNDDSSMMDVEDKEKGEDAPSGAFYGEEEAEMSERQRRRKAEIFIGGLHRDAKEDDIRKVFEKIGEIVEVRLLMDGTTGKNKGYAFLRYTTEALAKQAVSELAKVEVCGKLCGTAALEDNDTILLDNIDKKWKKTDLIRLLQEIGIENIDTVIVASDPSNVDINRGFAFLELETNRDAQLAFKKLQKRDAFGKGRNIKVSWTTPDEPNKDDIQKVKSVYLESVPSSWDEEKVRDSFKKFGEIERIVLARNIPASKRKDYAFVNYTTREAALSCVESFDKDEIFENGSKVNIRVSLAKPSQKRKGNKDVPRDKFKAVQKVPRETTVSGAKSFSVGYRGTAGDNFPFREQATWRQGYMAYNRGPPVQNYPFVVGEKRPYSSLGGPAVHPDPRGYPRARMDGPFPAVSHSTMPSNMTVPPYYQQPNVGHGSGTFYGASNSSSAFQARYDNGPYGSSRYPSY